MHLATKLFNQGSRETFRSFCEAAGIAVTANMLYQWQWQVRDKQYHKSFQGTESCKNRRKQLKRKKLKTQKAFAHEGKGPVYQSGVFHVLKTDL